MEFITSQVIMLTFFGSDGNNKLLNNKPVYQEVSDIFRDSRIFRDAKITTLLSIIKIKIFGIVKGP